MKLKQVKRNFKKMDATSRAFIKRASVMLIIQILAFILCPTVIAGIDKMLTMNIFVTERSYNLRKEFRNYVWDKDKDGNYINQPIDAYIHGIDSGRYYCLAMLLGKIQKPKSSASAAFAR